MARLKAGQAEVELLLAARHLQTVTGAAANAAHGLTRARQTLASAQTLLATDPTNAFVLAYDATRQACTAILAEQGLRPGCAPPPPAGTSRSSALSAPSSVRRSRPTAVCAGAATRSSTPPTRTRPSTPTKPPTPSTPP